jgi:hypothetical protein
VFEIDDRVAVAGGDTFFSKIAGCKGTVRSIDENEDSAGNRFIRVRLDDYTSDLVPFYSDEIIVIDEKD